MIRMAVLIAALAGNAWLSDLARGSPYGTVADAVRLGAYAVLWSAAYMWLSALWQQRPVLKELPRLSLSSVCVYVYGMGVLAFVTAYTFLGVSLACVLNYTISATCLCACDLLDRSDHSGPHRAGVAAGALFSLAAVIMVALGDPYYEALADSVGAGSWGWDDLFGILLPLLVPVLYHYTRDQQRHYSAHVVFELIHFAMPFAVILALVALAMVPPAVAQPPHASAPAAVWSSPEAGAQGQHTAGGPAAVWSFPEAGPNATGLALLPWRTRSSRSSGVRGRTLPQPARSIHTPPQPASSIHTPPQPARSIHTPPQPARSARTLPPPAPGPSGATGAGFTGITGADMATAALPLTSVLILFFAMQSVLLYSTIDFLTATAFVTAVKFFVHRVPDPEAVLAMSLASVAFLLRLCTSPVFDDDPRAAPNSNAYAGSEEEALAPAAPAPGTEEERGPAPNLKASAV